MGNVLSASDNGGTGRSGAVFQGCPIEDMLYDNNKGCIIRDDFVALNGSTSTTQSVIASGQNIYTTYQTSGHGAFKNLNATGGRGVAALYTDGNAQQDELSVVMGDGVTGLVRTYDATTKWWFEARVQLSLVTMASIFVGLMDGSVGIATDALTDSTGVPGSGNWIGFKVIEAAKTSLVAFHQTTTNATAIGTAATIAASTWYKLGLRFDGTSLYWYLNGTLIGSELITADYVPANSVYLVPGMCIKLTNSTHTATTMYADWLWLGLGQA
jgi:hypothetical protein